MKFFSNIGIKLVIKHQATNFQEEERRNISSKDTQEDLRFKTVSLFLEIDININDFIFKNMDGGHWQSN